MQLYDDADWAFDDMNVFDLNKKNSCNFKTKNYHYNHTVFDAFNFAHLCDLTCDYKRNVWSPTEKHTDAHNIGTKTALNNDTIPPLTFEVTRLKKNKTSSYVEFKVLVTVMPFPHRF